VPARYERRVPENQLRLVDRTRAVVITGLAVLAALAAAALWRSGIAGYSPEKHPVRPPLHGPGGLDRLPARPGDVIAQKLDPVDADTARKLNAATPFADIHPAPARPFHFIGTALDRARALDCLALAAMAEAGGSDPGQRAVMQVVLNRVRHPAFAKTICGVVFEGSERSTGCQFSFTCDGSLARRYSDAAWQVARRRASQALDGRVFTAVGAATHYHTDWVHPVWSGELDKIAKVDTHLFFRWPGYWGSRDAARIAYRGGEPAIAKIAWLDSHAAAAGDAAPTPSDTPAALAPQGHQAGERVGIGQIVARHPEVSAFLVHLMPKPSGAAALLMGRRLCGGRGYCQVLAWADRKAIPSAFPVTPTARAKLSFSYVLDATNSEYVFYDCKIFTDTPRDKCLPPQQ